MTTRGAQPVTHMSSMRSVLMDCDARNNQQRGHRGHRYQADRRLKSSTADATSRPEKTLAQRELCAES